PPVASGQLTKLAPSRKRVGIPRAHSWVTGGVPDEDGHSLGSWIEHLWAWMVARHDSLPVAHHLRIAASLGIVAMDNSIGAGLPS
ncbi:hypothetical protein TNCV_1239941, partial [Trichonephila clavipes]